MIACNALIFIRSLLGSLCYDLSTYISFPDSKDDLWPLPFPLSLAWLCTVTIIFFSVNYSCYTSIHLGITCVHDMTQKGDKVAHTFGDSSVKANNFNNTFSGKREKKTIRRTLFFPVGYSFVHLAWKEVISGSSLLENATLSRRVNFFQIFIVLWQRAPWLPSELHSFYFLIPALLFFLRGIRYVGIIGLVSSHSTHSSGSPFLVSYFPFLCHPSPLTLFNFITFVMMSQTTCIFTACHSAFLVSLKEPYTLL